MPEVQIMGIHRCNARDEISKESQGLDLNGALGRAKELKLQPEIQQKPPKVSIEGWHEVIFQRIKSVRQSKVKCSFVNQLGFCHLNPRAGIGVRCYET